MKPQHLLARLPVTVRRQSFLIDLVVILCGLSFFFGMIRLGTYWLARPIPEVAISHSVRALPLYACYSIGRMGIAYVLSLLLPSAMDTRQPTIPESKHG